MHGVDCSLRRALSALFLATMIIELGGCAGGGGDLSGPEAPPGRRDEIVHEHLALGQSLIEQSRYAEALHAFDRALIRQPDHPDIHYHRGVALHRLAAQHQGGLTKEGNRLLSQATASYARAVELGSKDGRAYYALGHINTGGGHSEDTLRWMNRAIELDPDLTEAHYERARSLWGLGRTEEALQSFARVLELKPDFARAHMRRARLLAELNRFEEALRDHDRAIELAPDDSKVHFNRGRTLAKLGRHEEALEAHERAAELWPRFHGAHLGRGEAHEALGRVEEALQAYRRAERLDPYGRTVEPKENYNYMATLLKGRLLASLGRDQEALKAFDDVLATQPDNEEIKKEREDLQRKIRAEQNS